MPDILQDISNLLSPAYRSYYRIVYVVWPHIHSGWSHWQNSMSCKILILQGVGMFWYARPQLFFKFTLCPTGEMGFSRRHKEYSLFFFSTFEPISLITDSCMQRKGVPMLYERSSAVLPTLCFCPVENVLGQVPLILLLEWQHMQYHTA